MRWFAMFWCDSFNARHKTVDSLSDTIVHIVIEYKQMLMQLGHVDMIAISHATFMNLTNLTKIVVSNFD